MAGPLWEHTAELPIFPPLRGEQQVDVLIIGGGMAGVLTAYFLHQAGVKYALVEKGRIGSGITCRTTAKITAQHGLIYHKLLKTGGIELAQAYLRANQTALESYAELCNEIDCDFVRRDHVVYEMADERKIEDELEALQRIGFAADCPSELPLPFSVAGAVGFPGQAQFHPLKFLAAIAEGLHIYEQTFVRELVGTTAVTDDGRIHADQVIVTTHFPLLNKHGGYFLKLYQHRSYVLALEGAPPLPGMYVDDDKRGLSFRQQGRHLLLGGGGHRTGKPGDGWQGLRALARQHYPAAVERYYWAAQDCMSLDSIPYIGQYAKTTPRLFVAGGFNKWGMTGSMVAAQLLRDLVTGADNAFTPVFNPSRSIWKPQLAVNGLESAMNLLTPTAPRCPHLGCALKWNKAEHSWDCSCHGSRFSEDGKLLDNPANGDLPKKK